MLFSDRIPEPLRSAPFAEKFVRVLDDLQAYKDSEIFKGVRYHNPVLLTNLPYLRSLVEEFGYPQVPTDFPKEILDNMYLNAELVFRMRGSYRGLDHFLRVMTCGEPVIDASDFYPKSSYIILNDPVSGFLFSEDMFPNEIIYLYSGIDSFLPRFLTVDIATPYHAHESLKKYIRDHIYRFIGFVDENTTVTINFTSGPYVPNLYANQYFVNPS